MIRKKRDFTITIIIIMFVNLSEHFPDEHPKGPRITGCGIHSICDYFWRTPKMNENKVFARSKVNGRN